MVRNRPHRIPRLTSPPIGREPLVGGLVEALRERAGLTMLVGPGGAGKTFVAAHVAAGWSHGSEARAAWVDLQASRTLEDLDREVAWALDLGAGADHAMVARDLEQRGKSLLVLDNLEQLPTEVADRIDGWLAAAPSLRIVGTSRHVLGVRGEIRVSVEPLGLPAHPGEVRGSEAWEVLAHLAGGSVKDLPDATGYALLHSTDGLPLALELVAGRLEVVRAEELLPRLRAPLEVLADPDAPDDRHGSLHNAVAWSWSLLDPPARRALAQLTVFVGPFDLVAADAVMQGEVPTLDALHRLVRRCLVSRTHHGYRLLPSIRAFVRAQRMPDSRAATERYADWLSESYAGTADGGRDRAWIERALGHLPELLAMLRRAEAGELDALRGARCAVGACRLLELRGRHAEARGVADRGLSLPAPVAGGWLEARLWILRAEARRLTGDQAGARADLEQARARAEALGDRTLLLCVMDVLGNLEDSLGNLDEAIACAEEALSLATGAHPVKAAQTRAKIAAMTLERDRERQESHAAALELARAACDEVAGQDLPLELETVKLYGWMLVELLDPAAPAVLRHAADLADALDDRRGGGWIRGQLGLAAEAAGDLAEALRSYEEAVQRLTTAGNRNLECTYRGMLGRVLVRQGRWAEGLAALDHALADPAYPSLAAVRSKLVASRAVGRVLVGEEDPLPEANPFHEVWAELARATRALGEHRSAEALGILEAVSGAIPGTESAAMRGLLDDVVSQLRRRATCWQIHAAGAWFRAPGTEPVDLSRFQANARVLARLVRARVEEGTSLDATALFEAGWPGEHASDGSARNRVRVALSKLRSAGLRDLIVRDGAGWRLDPGVEIEVLEPPGAEV